MISVTDLRSGVVFEEDGDYYLVLSYEHIKMGRGSGNVKVKVRNLSRGSTIEKSFITGARVTGATVVRKKSQFLYVDGSNYYFMDMESFEQFALDKKIVEDYSKFLKEGLEVTLFLAEGKPLYIEIPKILEYKVSQTAGAAKGNTVGAAQKEAVLENGLKVKVPLFIKSNELIRVDTRNGEYVERAK
jgi:elongation factor P